MNHLNDCVYHWHCASGSSKDFLRPCSNGIPLQDSNQLFVRNSNNVAYRDPENCSMAIGQGHVQMPHKCLWGRFKVPFLYNGCLDDQFWSAWFDMQQLKLWILFTGYTSMPYDKWEWKKDHQLIKRTQHSLPSLRPPSTIVCRPGKQASLGSRQSLVQEVEHNVSAIQETVITWLTINEQKYFVVSKQIFSVPCQRFKQKDGQYPHHDSRKDLPYWYELCDGQTSQWSVQLSSGLPWLSPRGADRAARQFF